MTITNLFRVRFRPVWRIEALSPSAIIAAIRRSYAIRHGS